MLENEVSRQSSTTPQKEFSGLTEDSLDTIRNQLLALELIRVEKEINESEKWRLSERGLREHAQKNARRREP
jgi:hypothetical protein